ncbi:hypothetical protein CgunFtcFv8_017165 [Champsocephalus gunnari]|uniref:Uncharacterized protein n=1 Tax=Champsocephalus gunnari TaxID=52237 RepID=A0AAN8HQF7_CHAGU|nr:hypothetical protein CgunFtcFv8_017165 [Champsocephalus gunnari]
MLTKRQTHRSLNQDTKFQTEPRDLAQEQSVGHESGIRPSCNSVETEKEEMKCKAVGPLERVTAGGFKSRWTERTGRRRGQDGGVGTGQQNLRGSWLDDQRGREGTRE